MVLTPEQMEKINKQNAPDVATIQDEPDDNGNGVSFLEMAKGAVRGTVTGASSIIDLVEEGMEFGLAKLGFPQRILDRSISSTERFESLGLPTVSSPEGRIFEGLFGAVTTGPGAAIRSGFAGLLGSSAIEIAKENTDNQLIQAGVGVVAGLTSGKLLDAGKATGRFLGSFNPTLRKKILRRTFMGNLAAGMGDVEGPLAKARVAEELHTFDPRFNFGLAEAAPLTL